VKKIGFIGLGVMGKPMAKNLLKAGYELVVTDLRPEPVAELVAAGARAAASARDVAAGSEVIITMLPNSPEVKEAVLGPNGVIEGIRAGTIVADMSSIAPLASREISARLAEKGAVMLDAPVSGGEPGAIAGSLSIMVGGSEAAFARARPILDLLGRTIVHVGPAGAGQVVKLCNQVVVAVVLEAVSEALVLGAKAGVDPARIVEVLQGGLAATKVLEVRGANMLGGRFDPGFRTRLHLKDLRNALELARETGVVVPAAAGVEQLMQRLRISGRGDLDHSGLITVLEELADFRVCDAAPGQDDATRATGPHRAPVRSRQDGGQA
jgi:2-hydroxy-3-oxopropionate reductase